MSQRRRAVVTGAAGLLGQALMAAVPAGVDALGVTRADGDLATAEGVAAVLARRPDVVIHAAAYTDVDGCERDPARAFRDNALATRMLAAACARDHIRLVLISTDYVFDGSAGRPYREDDLPCPINVYGETKLAAERAAAAVADHLIIRTQWLFGPGRRNFVASVLQKALAGEKLQVIADQWGCPTYTVHLAAVVWELAVSQRRGVVHAAASGIASWWDVASAACAAAGIAAQVEKISMDQWPAAARRPRLCALSCRRLTGWIGRSLPPWRQGVEQYVSEFLAGRAGQ